jgi:hypothetical protein
MRVKKGTILYHHYDSSEYTVVSLEDVTFTAMCKAKSDYIMKIFKYSDIGTILSFDKTQQRKLQTNQSKNANTSLSNDYPQTNENYFFYNENVKRFDYNEKLEITSRISEAFKNLTHYKSVEENLMKLIRYTSKIDLESNDSTFFLNTLLGYTFELIEFCLIKGYYLTSMKLTRIISNESFIKHVYKYFFFWRYSSEYKLILKYLSNATLYYEILSDEEQKSSLVFGHIFSNHTLNDHYFKSYEINNSEYNDSRFDRNFYNYLNKLNREVGNSPFIETTLESIVWFMQKKLSVRNIIIFQDLLPIMLCNDIDYPLGSIDFRRQDLYNRILDIIRSIDDMKDFFINFNHEIYKSLSSSTISFSFDSDNVSDQLTIVRIFIHYYINGDEPLDFSDFVSNYFNDYCSEYSSKIFKNLSIFLNISNYSDTLIQFHRKIIRLVTRNIRFEVSPTEIIVNFKIHDEEINYSIKKYANKYMFSYPSGGTIISLDIKSFLKLFTEHLFFQISLPNVNRDESNFDLETLIRLDKRNKTQILYTIIKDYRENEAQMSFSKVERWINQFKESDQDSMLNETILLFDRMYFSKARFRLGMRYFNDLLTNYFENIGYSCDFYIINNQKIGSSQKDMVSLFDEFIKINGMHANKSSKPSENEMFIYMDDGMYTGNRAKWEIKNFIIDNNLSDCKIFAFFICAYEESVNYLRKSLQEFCFSKKINLFVIRYMMLEHRLTPMKESYNKACQNFESRLEYERERDGNMNWPIISLKNYQPNHNLFSLDDDLKVFRTTALDIGLKLIESYDFTNFRPLGYTMFYNYGFGNVYISYRNISNNSPLFLWFPRNDTFKWYPLFERKTNPSEQWHDLIEYTKRNLK